MTAFEHTTEGYKSAYEWLEDVGLLTDRHKDLDGFSLVGEANWERTGRDAYYTTNRTTGKIEMRYINGELAEVGIDEGVPGGDRSAVNGVIEE